MLRNTQDLAQYWKLYPLKLYNALEEQFALRIHQWIQ